MKEVFKIAIGVAAFVLMLIPDVNAQFGIERRAARRTTVVVASTATKAAGTQAAAAQQQTAAAQQQAAAATQQAAAATQQAAASQQEAAAAEQEAADAKHELAVAQGVLPLGTVVHTLPPGCVSTAVDGVEYYQCGVNYYRAVFEGNSLVYVTAQPKTP